MVAVDVDALDAVDHRASERVGNADADLEPTGVGRLVAEQDQVEDAVGGLDVGDRRGNRRSGALRIPVGTGDRQQHRLGHAEAGRIAQLLVGLGRPEGQHGCFATVLLDQLHRLFDSALLVRAHRETEERGVDRLAVGGDVDARPGGRHALHADQDPHDFMRESSGSNSGVAPARSTVTGYSSFMYMTCNLVPSTACCGGR